jgi:hypothetical protein
MKQHARKKKHEKTVTRSQEQSSGDAVARTWGNRRRERDDNSWQLISLERLCSRNVEGTGRKLSSIICSTMTSVSMEWEVKHRLLSLWFLSHDTFSHSYPHTLWEFHLPMRNCQSYWNWKYNVQTLHQCSGTLKKIYNETKISKHRTKLRS